MKYWPYVVREDEPCLPSWFSYRLPAARSGEDWWKSRWNGQTAEDGRSIKDHESTIRGSRVLIPRTAHPCYFKQRHEAMLAFATRTHHTLLENVQILFLTPPLSWSFFLFFFFFPFFFWDNFSNRDLIIFKWMVNEEEFVNKNTYTR